MIILRYVVQVIKEFLHYIIKVQNTDYTKSRPMKGKMSLEVDRPKCVGATHKGYTRNLKISAKH